MNVINFLHRFRLIRYIARRGARKLTIRQPFYSGAIFLNAVEHSWAWTGGRTYMTFDRELQDFLHQESLAHDFLIDIGCNIGVMTVGTLMHNPKIYAVAVDPNRNAIGLLKKTLKYNQLSGRCRVIHAAAGTRNGKIKFDGAGSVTGHIAENGEEVDMIGIAGLLNNYSGRKTLVKVDIEGYESQVVAGLKEVTRLADFTFLIEFHEYGFNGVGDPQYVLDTLKGMGGKATDLAGNAVEAIDPAQVSQLVVRFS
jgi:FkbM family methyltransferase